MATVDHELLEGREDKQKATAGANEAKEVRQQEGAPSTGGIEHARPQGWRMRLKKSVTGMSYGAGSSALASGSASLRFKGAGKDDINTAMQAFEGGGGAVPYAREMEQKMGLDLSEVRAHTGPAAQAACEELGAEAFTYGNHIAFKQETPDRGLVAHEVKHAEQQGAAKPRDGDGAPSQARSEDAEEQEADLAEAQVQKKSSIGLDDSALEKEAESAGQAVKDGATPARAKGRVADGATARTAVENQRQEQAAEEEQQAESAPSSGSEPQSGEVVDSVVLSAKSSPHVVQAIKGDDEAQGDRDDGASTEPEGAGKGAAEDAGPPAFGGAPGAVPSLPKVPGAVSAEVLMEDEEEGEAEPEPAQVDEEDKAQEDAQKDGDDAGGKLQLAEAGTARKKKTPKKKPKKKPLTNGQVASLAKLAIDSQGLVVVRWSADVVNHAATWEQLHAAAIAKATLYVAGTRNKGSLRKVATALKEDARWSYSGTVFVVSKHASCSITFSDLKKALDTADVRGSYSFRMLAPALLKKEFYSNAMRFMIRHWDWAAIQESLNPLLFKAIVKDYETGELVLEKELRTNFGAFASYARKSRAFIATAWKEWKKSEFHGDLDKILGAYSKAQWVGLGADYARRSYLKLAYKIKQLKKAKREEIYKRAIKRGKKRFWTRKAISKERIAQAKQNLALAEQERAKNRKKNLAASLPKPYKYKRGPNMFILENMPGGFGINIHGYGTLRPGTKIKVEHPKKRKQYTDALFITQYGGLAILLIKGRLYSMSVRTLAHSFRFRALIVGARTAAKFVRPATKAMITFMAVLFPPVRAAYTFAKLAQVSTKVYKNWGPLKKSVLALYNAYMLLKTYNEKFNYTAKIARKAQQGVATVGRAASQAQGKLDQVNRAVGKVNSAQGKASRALDSAAEGRAPSSAPAVKTSGGSPRTRKKKKKGSTGSNRTRDAFAANNSDEIVTIFFELLGERIVQELKKNALLKQLLKPRTSMAAYAKALGKTVLDVAKSGKNPVSIVMTILKKVRQAATTAIRGAIASVTVDPRTMKYVLKAAGKAAINKMMKDLGVKMERDMRAKVHRVVSSPKARAAFMNKLQSTVDKDLKGRLEGLSKSVKDVEKVLKKIDPP